MQQTEWIVLIGYLLAMLAIGVYFFLRSGEQGEKDYFLGGRQMGPWVSALSAGASDMSAWSLMGLPASVFAFGMGKAWIAIGLLAGYALSWILEAPRLRRFTIVCGDSITIPQYLTNRFLSKSNTVRVLCALLFLIAYTIYAASSMKACGTLLHTVTGMNAKTAMYLSAVIIIGYTFLGGYSAVCWTDFFQGLLMLGALLVVPLVAFGLVRSGEGVLTAADLGRSYWSFFSVDGRDILSGLGWGLGYFGMPHILVRFMSVRSDRDLRKSAVIGISWTFIILSFGVLVGAAGRMYLGAISDSSTVFIQMVRSIFPALLSGILLSAILAASMSTADSQLLAAGSAFSSDIYKPLFRKNASQKEMLWAGRLVVVFISLVAVLIASAPNSGSVMDLVENAWGLFGAAFGPALLLSIFWKQFTFAGAAAAILVGGAADLLWLIFLSSTGIYEIVPAFLIGLLTGILVSKWAGDAPSAVQALYEDAVRATSL